MVRQRRAGRRPRLANDFVAGVVSRHPSRFFGLCVLPLLDMQASIVELDRAVQKLGMRGILLYTNLAGRFPDEPEFRPLFARAVELDVPVLLHPAKPVTTELVKGYEMTSTLGNMFDNTIALTRLLMSGILDEFPRLKLVCPHLGGTLPYIVGRLDHQVTVLKRGPRNLTRAPSEYLKQIWLDIVSPLPLAMKFAVDFMGADRLLYASDHPWVEPGLISDCLASLNLSAADEQKIRCDNARSLFRLSRRPGRRVDAPSPACARAQLPATSRDCRTDEEGRNSCPALLSISSVRRAAPFGG